MKMSIFRHPLIPLYIFLSVEFLFYNFIGPMFIWPAFTSVKKNHACFIYPYCQYRTGDQVRIETETLAWYISNPLSQDGNEIAFGYDGRADRIVKKVTEVTDKGLFKESYFSSKPKDKREVAQLPFRYPTNKGRKWTPLKRSG